MLTFLTTDPDRATEALAVARREYDRFLADGPTDAELTAAKNKIASASVLRGELPMGRLTAVGHEWVYRCCYPALAEQIEEMTAVAAEEVLAVAREYDLANTFTLALGPNETL